MKDSQRFAKLKELQRQHASRLGDTKAGSTATKATSRAEALQAYIKDQNAKGKKLVGGIIINEDTKKCRVNQQDNYNYDKNDLTKWDFFDNII